MNKLFTKITVVVLCAALCAGGIVTAFAKSETQYEKPEEEPAVSVSDLSEKIEKDETVYVLAGADGSVKKIIVSDWLKNVLCSASVEDRTELSDIENVKGDETVTGSGAVKVWDAHGNDLYYQGNIEKELPVGMSVTYTLDGKNMTADEIAGKSGRVSIRFDYENRQYETVKINGEDEELRVPFVMLTGMLLDSDHFRNVEVSNGKLFNDGDRTAVIGFALPGLQENLKIGKERIELFDHVEITADVTDFSMGMTLTVAVNELFNSIDPSVFDSADDLTDSIEQLSDGMQQLIDGSSALYDGICTLWDKSGELVDGIGQLSDGAITLKNGISSVDDGAGKLQTGAKELSKGLNTLKDNNDALAGGAKQVFETLLSTAETQIKAAGISVPELTIRNYPEVLADVVASLNEKNVYDQALAQVTAAVEANRELIVQKVTAAVREKVEAEVRKSVSENVSENVASAVRKQITEQVIQTAAGMSGEEYDVAVRAGLIPKETQDAVSAAVKEQMASENVAKLTESNIAEQMKSREVQAAIKENTDAQIQTESVRKTISENVDRQVEQAISDNMASDEVQSKLDAAKEGVKTLSSLKESLDSYNTFYLGLLSYTDGVAAAADGAVSLASGTADLKNGTAQLKNGSSELSDGILQLKNSLPALTDGVSQLKDGGLQLSDGIKKFNEDGVQKITELVDGDLDTLVSRLKATVELSKKYRNFSGIGDDMDGKVRFIYRTEEIE